MDCIHIINFNKIYSADAVSLSQRLGVDILTNFIPVSGHIYIVFGGEGFRPLTTGFERAGPLYIIINKESPQSDILRNKYYIQFMRDNYVWDFGKSADYLKTLGIKVLFNEGDSDAYIRWLLSVYK
jgi:hypothetical protein